VRRPATLVSVTSWGDFESAEPEFATRVRGIMASRRHKTIATLRKDGSPRISGIELEIRDGEAMLGMMPESRKLGDVRRDPRIAIQATSADPPADNPAVWAGDAKLSGRVVERGSEREQPPGPRFTIDIEEVVLTHLDPAAELLVVESWHPGRGIETRSRA
jgi:hypothetical protein